MDSGWQRLHPLSPLVRSGRAVLAVLALAGLSSSGLIGSGTGTRWWDLALVALVAGGAVVNWLVTRWKVDGVTLRIETGLLRRDSRQLPIARIQAVDLVRPFFARMLGLAELRVRLAGSGDADGRLAYLTEQAAETLRARLLATHHGVDPATPEPAERVITSVPTGRLAGSALLPAALLATVAVAAGAVTASLVPGGLTAMTGPYRDRCRTSTSSNGPNLRRLKRSTSAGRPSVAIRSFRLPSPNDLRYSTGGRESRSISRPTSAEPRRRAATKPITPRTSRPSPGRPRTSSPGSRRPSSGTPVSRKPSSGRPCTVAPGGWIRYTP